MREIDLEGYGIRATPGRQLPLAELVERLRQEPTAVVVPGATFGISADATGAQLWLITSTVKEAEWLRQQGPAAYPYKWAQYQVARLEIWPDAVLVDRLALRAAVETLDRLVAPLLVPGDVIVHDELGKVVMLSWEQ
jgi:hypothetical protein